MPWLYINSFEGGINTDDARVKRNQALKMENLDISKRGLMKKRQGYRDLGLDGTPATMNTIFEWSNNIATDQNLVAEVDSNNASQLHQSSDAASFIILGANQLGNYIDRKTSNYLPFPGVSSDTISQQYFSAETKTISTHVRIGFGLSLATTDGVYNNWLLHNISRTTVRVITDYTTAGSPSAQIFKLDSAIPDQSTTDHFYITKNDWDKVHVYAEQNGVLRGGVGNASQNTAFWLGYLNGASFYGGAFAITDYVLVNNTLVAGTGLKSGGTNAELLPWSPVQLAVVEGKEAPDVSNFIDIATSFYYRFSLVYDDTQESFLISAPRLATPLLISENYHLSFSAIAAINPRIRKIKLYRSTASDGPYNFVDTISMNQASWTVAEEDEVTDRFSISYYDTKAILGDSYQDITGLDPTLDQPLRNYNYKYEVQIADRRFIAGLAEEVIGGETSVDALYTKSIRDYPNRVYWSHITPQLVICPDIFLQNNWMTFGEGGSDKIIGITRVLNQLIVFLENTTFVVRMTSGNVLTWEKVETIAGIGAVASQSIIDIGGRIVFAGRDNIYLFNLSAPVPLLDDRFEEDYQAISNKSSGVAVYYPKRRQYKITFSETETSINGTATMFITYVIDIRTGAVHKHQSLKESISYAVGIDGELFRTDGAAIYQDDDDSFTETIGIGYRSAMIDAGTPGDKNWKKILLHYQSDDDIKIKVYLRRKDQGRFGVAPLEVTFPAKPGSMTTKTIEINQEAEAIQLEIYTDNSANGTVKIGQIGLNYEQSERAAA